jgi:death-on-curing protein
LQNPRFVTIEEVIMIHDDQIKSFGGSLGIRDYGLLESAVFQPQASFNGQLLHPDIYSQSASYLYHLTMNHPFIDGNKRTAFAVTDVFIRINQYSLNINDIEAYDMMIKVATKVLNKQELILYLLESIIEI